MGLQLSTQSRHPLVERGHDLYETPAPVTRALLKVEPLLQTRRHIWEPACGRRAIIAVLREAGHEVVASDIENYGFPITVPNYWHRDFFLEHVAAASTAIVTDPPYRSAADFVRHALKLCPRVIMLMRLAFLESTGRTDILESGNLARVHIFRNLLPMMHRFDWTGPRPTSALAYAWIVWDRGHIGPPTMHRLSWEPE
jgi:hypothetical protein